MKPFLSVIVTFTLVVSIKRRGVLCNYQKSESRSNARGQIGNESELKLTTGENKERFSQKSITWYAGPSNATAKTNMGVSKLMVRKGKGKGKSKPSKTKQSNRNGRKESKKRKCEVKSFSRGEHTDNMIDCFSPRFRKLYLKTKREMPKGYATNLTKDALYASKEGNLSAIDLLLLTDVVHLESKSDVIAVQRTATDPSTPYKELIQLYGSLLDEENLKRMKLLSKEVNVLDQLLKDIEAISKKDASIQMKDSAIKLDSLEYRLAICPTRCLKRRKFLVHRNKTVNSLLEDTISIENIHDLGNEIKLTSIFYDTLHHLVNTTDGNFGIINSRVISTSMHQLKDSSKEDKIVVRVRLRHLMKTKKPTMGVFLNLSGSESRWETAGCRVLESTEAYTEFLCNHLTNFAILITGEEDAFSDRQHEILSFLSNIGCFFSLVGSVLTLAAFALTRVITKRRILIINLAVCLAVAQALFLSGVEQAAGQKGLCTFVSISLHYFYTAAMLWMLNLGINLYLITSKPLAKDKFPVWKMALFAYITPGIELFIALLVTKGQGFGTSRFCWLSAKGGIIWTFLIPVLITITMNFGFLGFVLKNILHTKRMKEANQKKRIVTTTRSVILLTPLLGLTWIAGVWALSSKSLVMAYVFVVSNSFQGFFLFISNCVMDAKVRTALGSKIRTTGSTLSRVPEAHCKIVTKEDGPMSDVASLFGKVAHYTKCNKKVNPI